VLVQDEECKSSGPSEAYSGIKCTGTYLHTPGLPQNRAVNAGEDYPGPQDFNEIVGERLTINVHMVQHQGLDLSRNHNVLQER